MVWCLKFGDVVFVLSFIFVLIVEVVLWFGVYVVFVDIDLEIYCMDLDKFEVVIEVVKIEGELNFVVVIVVDFFGQLVDYCCIGEIIKVYSFKFIVDFVQGFGCMFDDKYLIYWVDVMIVSFYLVKLLGCYGDGGVVLMNDEELYDIMKLFYVYGEGIECYEYVCIGMNLCFDIIQVVVFFVKMDVFEDEIWVWNEVVD